MLLCLKPSWQHWTQVQQARPMSEYLLSPKEGTLVNALTVS